MAETLGSLCDKLTIVKLKQFHTSERGRLDNLVQQERQLCEELDAFLANALAGAVPLDRITFKANKVFKGQDDAVRDVNGTIGRVLATLADVNCQLWHEQEKVYDFEQVPAEEKDRVVKRLAVLNLERNNCIDAIDTTLLRHLTDRS